MLDKIKTFLDKWGRVFLDVVMATVTYIALYKEGIFPKLDMWSWLVYFILIGAFIKTDFKRNKYKKSCITFAGIFSFMMIIGEVMYENLYSFENNFTLLMQPINLLYLIGVFNIFYLLLTWSVPYLLDLKINKNINAPNKAKLIFILSFIVILLCQMPYFLNFYPGLLSTDSVSQLNTIINGFSNLSDHHPVMHTLFVAIPYYIGFGLSNSIETGVAFSSFTQMVCLSLTFAYLIKFLYERNANKLALTAIVRYEYRQGKGNVIRSMFRDIDADCYLMIDGDDTYPKENAREMCDLILNGRADMVIGDRLSSTYFTENKRPFHNLGNKMVRFLINRIFKNKIKDIMTGYRAFSREFVKGFPVLSKGFEIETEMTIHAVDKNYKLVEIPVTYRDRPEGSVSKLNTYSDGFKVLKTIATLFKEYKPAFFFNIISFIFAAFSLVLGIPVVVEYFKTGLVPRFPSLIVSCIFLVIALLLWITGIILQVIVKKDKQQYELYLNLLRSIKDENIQK